MPRYTANQKFNKPFVFKISARKEEIILAAKTKQEYDRWLQSFKDLQEEWNEKKNEILANENI
jgi:hypothetical protein